MKTLLLVDDDRDFTESLQILLADEGFMTHVLYDGRKVYREVQKTKPDLIILDSRLPGEKGETIARRLKKSAKLADIPIIMVSAHHGMKKIALDAGADAFFTKPFAIEDLLKTIDRYVSID